MHFNEAEFYSHSSLQLDREELKFATGRRPSDGFGGLQLDREELKCVLLGDAQQQRQQIQLDQEELKFDRPLVTPKVSDKLSTDN